MKTIIALTLLIGALYFGFIWNQMKETNRAAERIVEISDYTKYRNSLSK